MAMVPLTRSPDGRDRPRTPHLRRAGRSGTSLDQALRDAGATLPPAPLSPPPTPADRPFTATVPSRGRRRPGHGWAPTWPPLAGYEVTSDQTPVLWPLIAGQGL